MRYFIFLGLLFQALPVIAQEQDFPFGLIEAFGTGCSSEGSLSNEALNNASKLVEQVKTNIRDKSECSSLPYTVVQANLTSLQNIYADYEKIGPVEKEYLSVKQEERLLLSQYQILSQDPSVDPVSLQQVQALTIDAQRRSAYYSAQLSSTEKNKIYERRTRAYQNLRSGTEALLKDAVNAPLCWAGTKSLVQGISAAASTVIASTLNPAWSIPISTTADLAGQLIEIIRLYKVNKAIRKMESGVTAAAYSCAIEKISRTWCDARDIQLITRKKAEALEQASNYLYYFDQDPLLGGIQILERDLKIFIFWLDEVYDGTLPNNEATAERRANSFERLRTLEAFETRGIGQINENEKIFRIDASKEERWTIVKKAVNNIVGESSTITSNGHSITNPAFEIYERNIALYYIIGIDPQYIPKQTSGSGTIPFSEFETTEDFISYDPQLSLVRVRFSQWLGKAHQLMEQQSQAILYVDPSVILRRAAEETRSIENRYRMAPVQALEHVIAYLELRQKDKIGRGFLKASLDDVVVRLKEIYKEILLGLVKTKDSKGNPIPVDQAASEALAKIYELAKLDSGPQSLETSVRGLVRAALEKELENKTNIDPRISDLLLVSNDLLGVLENRDSLTLQQTKTVTETAKTTTQRTLAGFADLFDNSLEDVLKNFDKATKTANNKEATDNQQRKAELCLKLLTFEKWPKTINTKFCEGTQIQSVFPKGPKSPIWRKELTKLPMEERICLYHDYMRTAHLYEISKQPGINRSALKRN